jgi:hypothetical protein
VIFSLTTAALKSPAKEDCTEKRSANKRDKKPGEIPFFWFRIKGISIFKL